LLFCVDLNQFAELVKNRIVDFVDRLVERWFPVDVFELVHDELFTFVV